VLSNGYTERERERERLSLLLSASSIKQERAIDNADTGNKNQRKRQETRNVERARSKKGLGIFFVFFFGAIQLYIGGRISDTDRDCERVSQRERH
jgi:hypothetical protein